MSETIKYRCTITGLSQENLHFSEHSPEGNALKLAMKNALLEAIEEGYQEFFCGMELGCELWAGEILLELRKEFSIKITSVLASEHRADLWSDEDRERYFDQILPRVDKEIYTSKADSPEAMVYRNQFLANETDRLIAVRDGADISPVADLIRKVNAQNKEVVFVNLP